MKTREKQGHKRKQCALLSWAAKCHNKSRLNSLQQAKPRKPLLHHRVFFCTSGSQWV